jgi:hypothetical protein
VAAGARGVEWHFADKTLADFFRERFRQAGLLNIDVYWTEAIVKKIELSWLSEVAWRSRPMTPFWLGDPAINHEDHRSLQGAWP